VTPPDNVFKSPDHQRLVNETKLLSELTATIPIASKNRGNLDGHVI
jgi:hypothetical protein